METIEEIAIKIATQRVGNDYSGKAPLSEDARDWHMIYSACYEALTEQDRISRTEERERCIKAAREAVIEELSDDIRADAGDVAQGVENILRRKFRKQ